MKTEIKKIVKRLELLENNIGRSDPDTDEYVNIEGEISELNIKLDVLTQFM